MNKKQLNIFACPHDNGELNVFVFKEENGYIKQGIFKCTVCGDIFPVIEGIPRFLITKDIDVLTEYVRQGLARTITRQYQNKEGSISLLVLDPKLEEVIAGNIHHTDQGSYIALEPAFVQKIVNSFDQMLEKFVRLNCQPLVLCPPVIRGHFKRLLERFIPQLAVISPNEITPGVKIESLGEVVCADGR